MLTKNYFKAIFAFFIFSIAHPAFAADEDEHKLYELTAGDVTLTIPRTYTAPIYKVSKGGVWLYLSLPDFKPMEVGKGELNEVLDRGEAVGVSILKTPDYKNKEIAATSALKKNKADSKVGDSGGLVHYNQSDALYAANADVWIDKSDKYSYIVCSDPENAKGAGRKSIPTCSHYIYRDDFYILLYYNKPLFSDWRAMKDKTLALYQGFKDGAFIEEEQQQ